MKSHWGAMCRHPAGQLSGDSVRQERREGAPISGGNRYWLRMRTAGFSPPWPSESRGCNQSIGTAVNSPGLPHLGDSWVTFTDHKMTTYVQGEAGQGWGWGWSRLAEERCSSKCQHRGDTFNASSGSASHKTRHIIVS